MPGKQGVVTRVAVERITVSIEVTFETVPEFNN